jgi:competence protein ComEC
MKNLPALKSAIIIILGILIGSIIQAPFLVLMGISGILALSTLIFYITHKTKKMIDILLVLSLLSTGILRYHQVKYIHPPCHILHYLDISEPVHLSGYLIKDPDYKSNKIDYVLEARTLTTKDTIYPVCGKVLISQYKDNPSSLKYGDSVIVSGHLLKPKCRRNPGGFDYRSYLERKDIHCMLKMIKGTFIIPTEKKMGNIFLRNIVYPVRRFAIQIIDNTTTGESRSLLGALLIGIRGNISPEVRDSFAKTGMIHILAVSGLHVGFVLLVLSTIFGFLRIPYSFRVVLIILGLIFYALITEAKAPVVRAATMASLYLLSTLLERRSNPYNIIGFSALLLLLYNPGELFNVGFQLSFAAVISIVYFYQKLSTLPLIIKLNQKNGQNFLVKSVIPVFLVSLAAQLGTLPLTAVYFNRIPLLSIIINIFAIPLGGLIVSLGFTSLLFAPVYHGAASVYGALNQEILSGFISAVQWLGNLPFSHVTIFSPDILTILSYLSFILLIVNYKKSILRKWFIFLFLISINLVVWKATFTCDSNKLTWIQLDVGQGDSALLRLPREKIILIDGGEKKPHFDNGERVIAPYLRKMGIRKLDAVILTHAHNDHLGGLIYILENFKIGRIITSGASYDSYLHTCFLKVIEKKRIPLHTITAPDSLIEFPGVKILFHYPVLKTKKSSTNTNNKSIVTSILYGKTKLLFMGDAESKIENEFLRSMKLSGYNILKTGHHGSKTSSTVQFLQKVNPQYAVISVGEGNRFKHPSDVIIDRYKDMGIKIYRTDNEGAVIFKSDGKTIKNIKWK